MEIEFNSISAYAGGINVLDMRNYSPNYDLGKLPAWLNSQSLRNFCMFLNMRIVYNAITMYIRLFTLVL